ncbi:MAG: 3-hydroxyisobutyrate dehydrogenase [Chloroflexia bacterium]
MSTAIGFIGVGTMGRPMALNLLKAGHRLTVYDVRAEAAEALVAHGAVAVGTAREAAAAGDVVISMLPASAHVMAAMFGADGIIAGLRPGTLVADMSTIDPGTARRVAEAIEAAGSRMIDAPVSGGDKGAIAGTLTIMVGGDPGVLGELRDILGVMGTNVIHCGASGMGQTVKLCNNLILGIGMVALAEGFALGTSAGVDPQLLYDVLTKSTSRSWVMETRPPVAGLVPGNPVNDDYAPGFMTDLMHKDMGLALTAGNELHVPLTLTALAHQLYGMTSAKGLGRKDFSSVAKMLGEFGG